MSENTNKKENLVLIYAFYLAIFSGVAALVLAVTFQVTEPRKLENFRKIELASRKEVLPAAETFVDKAATANEAQALQYVNGLDKKQKIVGYVIKATASGYNPTSPVEFLVGVDAKYNIVGVKVLSNTETPGLGTKASEDWFTSQFVGKPLKTLVVQKDGGEIVAITGATITSRALTNAVKNNVEALQQALDPKQASKAKKAVVATKQDKKYAAVTGATKVTGNTTEVKKKATGK